jgi:hypothetical protein
LLWLAVGVTVIAAFTGVLVKFVVAVLNDVESIGTRVAVKVVELVLDGTHAQVAVYGADIVVATEAQPEITPAPVLKPTLPGKLVTEVMVSTVPYTGDELLKVNEVKVGFAFVIVSSEVALYVKA